MKNWSLVIIIAILAPSCSSTDLLRLIHFPWNVFPVVWEGEALHLWDTEERKACPKLKQGRKRKKRCLPLPRNHQRTTNCQQRTTNCPWIIPTSTRTPPCRTTAASQGVRLQIRPQKSQSHSRWGLGVLLLKVPAVALNLKHSCTGQGF